MIRCLFVILFAASASAADKPLKPIAVVDLGRTDAVSYEKEVEPVLAEKCLFCHSGNVIEGKYDMSTYAGVLKGGKRGVAVVAGKPDESNMYKFSTHTMKPVMPPNSEEPLLPKELALIKLWIGQGAKPPTGVRIKRQVVVHFPPALVRPVRGLAISPDKTLVAVGRGNKVSLYDGKDGKHVRDLVDPKLVGADNKPAGVAHVSLVESMAFSPDGKTLLTGGFQQVAAWNAIDGKLITRIEGFLDRVVTLAYSPDGKRFATGGGAPTEDGELRVFSADFKLQYEVKPSHSDTVFGVAFSPDNTKLASCGADKFVKVWDANTGKFIKSFEGHTHHVLDVDWKMDGKFLASAGADENIKVWDYEKGEQARTMKKAHPVQVTRLAFASKANVFVTVGGDPNVKAWNPDNGGNSKTFKAGGDFLYAVAISSDGKLVVAGGEEGVAYLFNGESGALVKALSPPGEEPMPEKKK